jgi:deoxyribose-phosphate aldolase
MSTPEDLKRALGVVDLTRLERPDDAAAIDALAEKAVTPAGSVAAICVYP